MNEWQPMETAPKDGTPILTWSSGCEPAEAFLVMWWTGERAEKSGYGWNAYEVGHALMPNRWLPLPPKPEAAR